MYKKYIYTQKRKKEVEKEKMIVGIISTIVILTIGIIEIIRRYPEEIIDSKEEDLLGMNY